MRRRTPQELVRFRQYVTYYKDQGLPEYKAEQYAYDHLHIERKLRKAKKLV